MRCSESISTAHVTLAVASAIRFASEYKRKSPTIAQMAFTDTAAPQRVAIVEAGFLDMLKSRRGKDRKISAFLATVRMVVCVTRMPHQDDRPQPSDRTRTFLKRNGHCARCTQPLTEERIANGCCGKGEWLGEFRVLYVSQDEYFELDTYENGRYWARVRSERRREREENSEGWHTKEDVQSLYEMQNGRCYFCDLLIHERGKGPNPYEKDHLRPIARSGSHWPSNIALVCTPCNAAKGTSSEELYWKSMKRMRGEEWVKNKRAIITLHRKAKLLLCKSRRASQSRQRRTAT